MSLQNLSGKQDKRLSKQERRRRVHSTLSQIQLETCASILVRVVAKDNIPIVDQSLAQVYLSSLHECV